jgi:DNA helicase II / ATP-dependent DNA helicase PcrA
LSDCEFLQLVARNKMEESSPVFKAPSDESNKQVLVAEPSNSSTQSALRITTIHNVKGETLEALMLVSSRDKSTSDGYWTQWLDDPASEAARLAYVASSRPRKLIIWAIPNPSKTEKDRLKKVGFQVLALNTVVQKSQTKLDYF